MPFRIKLPGVFCLYQSENKESLPDSKTDKKASTIVGQALRKGNTTCPTGKDNLSPGKDNINSAILKTLQTEKTSSPAPAYSKIDTQKQISGLSSADVIEAKNAPNSTNKKTPPLPPSRSSTTCLSSTSERPNKVIEDSETSSNETVPSTETDNLLTIEEELDLVLGELNKFLEEEKLSDPILKSDLVPRFP